MIVHGYKMNYEGKNNNYERKNNNYERKNNFIQYFGLINLDQS